MNKQDKEIIDDKELRKHGVFAAIFYYSVAGLFIWGLIVVGFML